MLLHSLTEVGPTKPVGYLPLDTIRNFVRQSPEAVAASANARGLMAVKFGPDTEPASGAGKRVAFATRKADRGAIVMILWVR